MHYPIHHMRLPATLSTLAALFLTLPLAASAVELLPRAGATGVNPDTRLHLVFDSAPVLGTSGKIRIYDAQDDRLVDTLDLAIPAGPTTPRTAPRAAYLPQPYPYDGPRRTNADTQPGTPTAGVAPAPQALPGDWQWTIIGGFTEGFHFYPVIVRDKTAAIQPHHNLLAYGRTYYVQVDPGVLSGDGFKGITGKDWRFTTRPHGPAADAARVTVSADGQGDFSTVQGALDHVPDQPRGRTTIFVKNGDYEEIVYFRNKRNLTILGEDRDKVRIHYANNELFNPHPLNVATNEAKGTFPSRRAAFMADNVQDLALVNLTIETTAHGQAEGLLLNGERNVISHVTVRGSGDALQTNGTAYYTDFRLEGEGDTILGRGAAFFRRCDIASKNTFMWIRNPETNHGNVFVGCRFTAIGRDTDLARLPSNKGRNYPYAEAVLIDATLTGIIPAGWGEIGPEATHIRFLEANSRDANGQPVDTSQRHPASRQLDPQRDAALIAQYRDPAWVLGGWQPALAPLILAQPVLVQGGGTRTLSVRAAGVPDVAYRWYRDGKPVAGATGSELVPRAAGRYTVEVSNSAGRVISGAVAVGGI
ncbi:pectin methylesterase-like acyl-CoA thioesterase [Pseudoduganella lurida]|uniref:Pectin methylesterase-like acyl-CoA thioesterase n=1 Tax=Pseudoduganella lurida TaxID=1036180 RepID=A0A562RGT3_9BURK|nr:pectinesterase family protein [Pseudoduganella lurida]TWI67734.1 pectin methylesterase-like acyl-CoA thioesterase [Pseudoduganella lurida]